MNSEQLRECFVEADKRMKASNGHSFVTVLKTRCQYCGRSPAAKGKCSGWFQVFLDHLTTVIGEREVSRENPIRTLVQTRMRLLTLAASNPSLREPLMEIADATVPNILRDKPSAET